MCAGALSVASYRHNASNGICFAHRRVSRREFPPPISTGPALHIRGWHSPTPIGRGAGDEAHIVGHQASCLCPRTSEAARHRDGRYE
jgi:hypothetical protein